MRQRVRRDMLGGLAVGALALAVGCRAAPSGDVAVEVRNVGFDHQSGSPVVILEARESGRALPIWIGPAEAQAIAMELQNVTAPRPLTHDLVKQILDRTGVKLLRVRITDLREETFFATLILDHQGREMEIDSRPSDAIALALRFACPILVRRSLFASGVALDLRAQHEASVERVWGLTVQALSPAVAESLGSADTAGVVVSDVDDGAFAGDDRPQRGDVIVAVDGTPVADLAAVRAKAAEGGTVHRLEVRRGGTHLVLHVAPRG